MTPRWKAFAVLAIAFFMSILDLFIVNIAVPGLRREFPWGRCRSTNARAADTLPAVAR